MSNNPITRLDGRKSGGDLHLTAEWLKFLCLLAVGLLTALPAAAAGDKPPGPMDLVWQGVNLAVLLAILVLEPASSSTLAWGSLAFPAYYVALSLWLQARG